MLKWRSSKSDPLTQEKMRAFQAYASMFILGLVAVCAGWLFWRLITPRMDFYNELWGPATLLVRGESPYDTASLNPNLPAAWFPMAIGFFFPLGWLSETLALQVWFVFNILALCGLIYLAQGSKPSVFVTFILAVFCFFFPPVLNHLFLGQISITVTFCLALAAYFVDKDQRWWVAFFISLSFSKPHLAILAVLGLTYNYYRCGGLKAVLSFMGKVFVISILLCFPLFVAFPNWIPDAIESMMQNPFWLYPSLFVVYQRNFIGREYFLWGLSVALILALCWLLWSRKPVKNAFYWSLALAPLASPYVGSWDFVILLPLFFQTFISADWKRKIIITFSYILAWVGMALVQMQPSSDNHFFWWVPVWFVGVIALMTDWKINRLETAHKGN